MAAKQPIDDWGLDSEARQLLHQAIAACPESISHYGSFHQEILEQRFRNESKVITHISLRDHLY